MSCLIIYYSFASVVLFCTVLPKMILQNVIPVTNVNELTLDHLLSTGMCAEQMTVFAGFTLGSVKCLFCRIRRTCCHHLEGDMTYGSGGC